MTDKPAPATPALIPDARYPGGFRPTTLSDEWLVQIVLDIGRKALSGRTLDEATQADLIFQLSTLDQVCRAFDEKPQDKDSLRSTVLLCVEASFIIGARARGEDLALVREKQRQAAGGRKAAVTRRAQADASWGAHATELMSAIRTKDRSLSRDQVAIEVIGRWKLDQVKPPSTRTLVEHLKRCEEDGSVPTRQK